MTISADMPMAIISRASMTYEIPLNNFLPDQVKQMANPSDPDTIEICNAKIPEYPEYLQLCIYDRSKSMHPSSISGVFGRALEQDLGDFEELKTKNNRIYQPVFFCFGHPVTDSIYDYRADVASHLQGQGISQSYYDNFRTIIRECNYALLESGHFSMGPARSFIRSGARFMEEFIDPSHLGSHPNDFASQKLRINSIVVAHILNQEDERNLIRPELRNAAIKKRLALFSRVQKVKRLVGCLLSAPSTNDTISTACEILDDMKNRGVPLSINFLHLDSDASITGGIITRQSNELWQHTYRLATIYTGEEIEEFIGWFDQA